MAEFCCICNAKIGVLGEYGILDSEDSKHRKICVNCRNRKSALLSKDGIEGIEIAREKAIEYFQNFTQSDRIEDDVKKIICDWIEEGKKRAEIKQNEDKQKKEIEKRTDDALKYIEQHKMFMTTGYDFNGYEIEDYLGIVSGQVVLGTGFISEMGASLSDFLGVNSEMFADKMNEARNRAEERIIVEAAKKGGNAIIGIQFNYTTFSNNMVAVSINGTAVRIQKHVDSLVTPNVI